jgi:galactokinase
VEDSDDHDVLLSVVCGDGAGRPKVATQSAEVTGRVSHDPQAIRSCLTAVSGGRADARASRRDLQRAIGACDAGALGARMTGAGFGGSAIALVPAGSPGTVAGVVGAVFATRRLTPPRILKVTPVDGAHRVT